MRRILICFLLLSVSCAGHRSESDNILIVSIPPLKYIVESIVGDDFRIEVLLPSGASPETYEPTPLQMADVHNSAMVFSTGLIAFEQNILSKTAVGNSKKYIDLGRNVQPIDSHGDCAHHHGTDPHIWTSPKALRTMAHNAIEAISEHYPDSARYMSNFEALEADIDRLDSLVAGRIAAAGVKRFVVFHPAFSYYARDYGLEQIALEDDGKEPSAERMRNLVNELRGKGIKRVIYQKEFPKAMADVFAAEIGATAAEVDILNEDIKTSILRATDLRTEK